MTKYGVHAMNHKEMVTSATLANLPSALFSASSEERRDLTFIFLACSRMAFSWADTAYTNVKEWERGSIKYLYVCMLNKIQRHNLQQ